MPTIFQEGDVFHTEGLRSYAHGCDCAGKMDQGIGVAFKKKWPLMYEEYRARCQDGRFRLGDVFVWNDGDEVLYTLGIRQQPADKPKIAALEQALTKMAELAQNAGVERIGVPRIGAGPGGLDWPRVKKVLSEVGQKANVTLVVFEKFIRSPGA